MAEYETTPDALRRATQSQNSRAHSVRTVATPQLEGERPPARPVFLEQPLFINALAGPSRQPPALGTKSVNAVAATSVPMQTSRVGGKALHHLGDSNMAFHHVVAAAHSRKRAAGEAEDDENAEPASRNAKRARAYGDQEGNATAAAVAAAAKRRQQRKPERGAGADKLHQDTQQWRQKYRKAFPSFTFYFDAIDEATQLTLGVAVKKLGASVDNFFSKKVTHVVTARPIPTAGSASSAAGKENLESAAMSKASGRSRRPAGRSPKIYELPNGHRVRNAEGPIEHNPFIDSQDILTKALDFGLKIWSCDKLRLIIDRINHVSPSKDKKRDPSLPTLLRDEQLYGTRERDPVVPRSDMYYFPTNKMFLYVEDSTGEHRPIVIKEYDKPKRHEDPSWPVLWGGVEGRTGFYHYDGPITYERRAPPPAPAPAAQVGAGAGFGSTAARAVAPNLRRAVSLQNVTRHQQAQQAQNADFGLQAGAGRDEYIAASGNSQIITSNIASATSTAARSGAAQANRNGANPYVDKRLAVLSNRNVSVQGGALLGSAATAPAAVGSGEIAPAAAGRNRIAALKRTERPAGGLKRSISVDAGLCAPRVSMPPPPREEMRKPGYCENCRIKYDDFSAHVVSSRHRRFALKAEHWVELDELLEKIDRPYAVASESESELSLVSPGRSVVSEESDCGADEDEPCDDSGFQEGNFSRSLERGVDPMDQMMKEMAAIPRPTRCWERL